MWIVLQEASGNLQPGWCPPSVPCASLPCSAPSESTPQVCQNCRAMGPCPSSLQAWDGFPAGHHTGIQPVKLFNALWWFPQNHPAGPQTGLLQFSTGILSLLRVFNKMMLRGAQCISTEVKQRFSTSDIHFHKNVVVSRTQSPQEHLHAKPQVAALISLRGVDGGRRVYVAPQGGREASLWKQVMLDEWIKLFFRA